MSNRPVVVMGSSIFQQWYNVQDVLPYEVTINLAIGGTTTVDWLPLVGSQVLPLKPKVVMFYAGGNDLNRPFPAADIIERTCSMMQTMHTALPECKFYYFSIIRAPQKQPVWDQVDQINQAMQNYAAQQDWLNFVDINTVFHDETGKVIESLFVEDQLHLTDEAYDRMVDYGCEHVTA
jgi:lysophospholipase L1-like esterase